MEGRGGGGVMINNAYQDIENIVKKDKTDQEFFDRKICGKTL